MNHIHEELNMEVPSGCISDNEIKLFKEQIFKVLDGTINQAGGIHYIHDDLIKEDLIQLRDTPLLISYY